MFYTADFETTTTAPVSVWACGLCSSGDYKFNWCDNIDDFINYCFKLENPTIYFHNLKFDGEFIIWWLLHNGYTYKIDRKICNGNDFTTCISDDGLFYSISVYKYKNKHHTKKIEFLDSLKLLNFSVEKIAKDFNLPCKKGKIDYSRHNQKCEITQEEIEYLKNDVEIVARALDIIKSWDISKITVGSSALNYYKNLIGKRKFNDLFPLLDLKTDAEIRLSYKGGFTFVNPDYINKIVGEGIVLDVNSLYPSVMYNSILPYGLPIKFEGKYIKNHAYPLYIQSIRCRFKIKKNHLPTIQLRFSRFFNKTEYLYSSFNKKLGIDEQIEMTMTCIDLELFLKHYEVTELEYIDGYMFHGTRDLFKKYINYWINIKNEGTKTGNKSQRATAKLMLNSLYGKFGTNPLGGNKYPVIDIDKNCVAYKLNEYIITNEKGEPIIGENGEYKYSNIEIREPVYIPMACFITAYARYKTITTSQKIHEQSIEELGYSKYLYSDTDSIHMLGNDYPEGVEIDDIKLGAWAHEQSFKRAKFIQSKRYIEDVYSNKEKTKTELKITCAGLPVTAQKGITFDNFNLGATYSGKLVPKHVTGGIILESIDYTLK